MKKFLFTIISVCLLSLGASAQKITDGTWYNQEKSGKVKFYEVNGKLYGKIIWLAEPTRNGKPRVDGNNPDAKESSKPLVGLIFLKGFEKSGTYEWEDGTIYDPNNGKTYSSELKLENPNKLSVRGYIGISLLGRTSTFTRATNN